MVLVADCNEGKRESCGSRSQGIRKYCRDLLSIGQMDCILQTRFHD